MNRPVTATVFGILNIVFAAIGVFGLVGNAILLLAAPNAVAQNPVIAIIQANPTYAMWIKVSLALGGVVTIVLLAAGVGLLMVQEWGRKLSIGYGIYGIVMTVVGMIVNYLYLIRPLLDMASRQQGPERVASLIGAASGAIGGCLGIVYPVLLLIFMTRPKLRAAFQRRSASESTDAPADW